VSNIDIGSPADFVDAALHRLPDLIVRTDNLPATAEALCDLFARTDDLFDRDGPAQLISPAGGGVPFARPLTYHNVVILTHRLCRPVKIADSGERIPNTLPDRAAKMYLNMAGEWNLQPLAGISTAPLLSADGSMQFVEGYDAATELYCCNIPNLRVPDSPNQAEAAAALRRVREIFRTFPCRRDTRKKHIADSSSQCISE
jgi:hypothetical protein